MYIYGENRPLKWSIPGPALSGDPHCIRRPRIHFGKGAIRGANFSNFQLPAKYPRGGPHVVRHVGAEEARYRPERGPIRRIIGHMPIVHLRLKSVPGMVEFWARTSGEVRCTTALESVPRRARFGAQYFQITNLLGDIHVADLHDVRHVGAQGTRYCPTGSLSID